MIFWKLYLEGNPKTMPSPNRTRNAVYRLEYQVVWGVRNRKPLLRPPIDQTLKTALRRTCREYRYEISQLKVTADLVQFLISVPPRIAPAELVKHLKGVSARKILATYPDLRRKLVRGHLWASTYYVATVGVPSEEAVAKYVEGQRRR